MEYAGVDLSASALLYWEKNKEEALCKSYWFGFISNLNVLFISVAPGSW